jgi:hypothetical protein
MISVRGYWLQERTVHFFPGILSLSLSVSQCVVARTSNKEKQSYKFKFACVVGGSEVGKGLQRRIKIGFKELARIFVFADILRSMWSKFCDVLCRAVILRAPFGLLFVSSFLCYMVSPLASSFPHCFLQTLWGVCESSAVGLSVCGCVDTPLCVENQFKTKLHLSEVGNF